MSDIYGFSATDIRGQQVALSNYKGKVLLIVNTASQCGFTPQYGGLTDLHKKYADKGLVILGFPCNQFGTQEPGDNGQIATFCETQFGVPFPMMGKVDVKGAGAHPLFQWLTKAAPGLLGTEAIKWNFTKFLVGRNGKVIERVAPQTAPAAMSAMIEKALAAA